MTHVHNTALLSYRALFGKLFKHLLLFITFLANTLVILLVIVLFYIIFFILRIAARCLWDSDTDNYAQAIYSNVSEEISIRSLTYCIE